MLNAGANAFSSRDAAMMLNARANAFSRIEENGKCPSPTSYSIAAVLQVTVTLNCFKRQFWKNLNKSNNKI